MSTSTTMTGQVPAWANEIHTQLRHTDIDVSLDTVCDLLQLPFQFSRIPRPSKFASFSLRDWEDFFQQLGFKATTDSKHNRIFDHGRMLCRVSATKSCDSGDIRGNMNNAANMRSNIKITLVQARRVAFMLLEHATQLAEHGYSAHSVDEVREHLHIICTDHRKMEKMIQVSLAVTDSRLPGEKLVASAEVAAVIRKLETRHQMSVRDAFKQAMAYEENDEGEVPGEAALEIERYVTRYRQNLDVSVMKPVYDALCELLEAQTDADEFEKRRDTPAIPAVEVAKPEPEKPDIARKLESEILVSMKAPQRILQSTRDKLARSLADIMGAAEKELQSVRMPQIPPELAEGPKLREQLDELHKSSLVTDGEFKQAKEEHAFWKESMATQLAAVTEERDELKALLERSDDTDPWRPRLEEILNFIKKSNITGDHSLMALMKLLTQIESRVDTELSALAKMKKSDDTSSIPSI